MLNRGGDRGPLEGVRVIEVTTRLGAYAGRLLADLGADVVRLEPSTGVAERTSPPLSSTNTSHSFAFTEAGKRSVIVDLEGPDAEPVLDQVLKSASIFITSAGPAELRRLNIHPDQVLERHPEIVHLSVSPFGLTGPWADRPASDVTLLAAGGMLSLAGDPDRAPVRAFGEQSSVIAGLHAAVGCLMALLVLEETGQGQVVDVSAQEAIAHSLENAAQYVDLEGIVRRRVGSTSSEAGLGLFPCSDGWVYLVGSLGGLPIAWDAIVDWLLEAGLHDARDFADSRWLDLKWRRSDQAVRQFNAVFESFCAGRSKVSLYEEAQARGISLAPVATLLDLLEDPQLIDRDFYRSISIEGVDTKFPGSPYRFASSVVAPRSGPPTLGEHTAEVMEEGGRPRASLPEPARDPRDRMPLAGLRVADFTWVGAGPYLTKPLADHGADVIKIESRRRTDPIRKMAPFRDGVKGLNRSGYFANRNSSKRSICLDLKTEEGLRLARELIAISDVVVSNFTAGTMERLGLGYDELKKINPEIICLEMPLQGNIGPRRDFRGFGHSLAAASGIYDLCGYPDRRPVGTGTNYPDHVPNPLHGAVAVLAALRRRRQLGLGEYIELSQLESTVNVIGPALVAAAAGEIIERVGNADTSMAPHGVYPCSGDDEWCAIAVQSDEQWRALAEVLSLGDEAASADFDGAAVRREQRDRLEEVVSSATRNWGAPELADALCARGVPASAVSNAADVIDGDPQLKSRNHWIMLDHPEMGTSIYDGIPYRLSKTPGALRGPAPLLGADTHEVCVDLLGLSENEYNRLVSEGKVG